MYRKEVEGRKQDQTVDESVEPTSKGSVGFCLQGLAQLMGVDSVHSHRRS